MKKGFLTLVCLTVISLGGSGCSTSMSSTEGTSSNHELTIGNVYYTVKDSDVIIHYDLDGPVEKPYQVQLVLRRQGMPTFKMRPHDVSGDIGDNEQPGQDRMIVWHLYKDVPYGLDGNDYYFEVSVTRLGENKGGTSWLVYVGGAVLGGVAAVYFGTNLFQKSGGSSIPSPPLRPQ